MLSVQEFAELFPRCKDPEGWVEAMEELFPGYGITTPARIAAFIAQCGHESAGFRTFEENLNYSAKALNMVFPKYFERAGRDAEEYHRQPEKIANVVYANRMGNGSIESGDGWRFRGRGPIQLTGRTNYETLEYDTDYGVVDRPERLAEDPEVGLIAALWFWDTHGLNGYADRSDIKGLTKRINGGYNGLEDRIKHYNEIMEVLGDVGTVQEDDTEFEEVQIRGSLKRGSTGEAVKLIQSELGLQADGIFGRGTEAAVMEWQAEHELFPDGIVGPKTLQAILED